MSDSLTPWTSPSGSSRGVFQARVLECAAISFSRGSSQPREWTWVSCIADRHFTIWATREVQVYMRELIQPKMSGQKQCLQWGKWHYQRNSGQSITQYCFYLPGTVRLPALEKTSMPVFFLLFFCLVLILLKYLARVFLVSHLKFLPKNHKDIHRKTKNTVSGWYLLSQWNHYIGIGVTNPGNMEIVLMKTNTVLEFALFSL